MKKDKIAGFLKKGWPYLVIIAGFILISYAFAPYVLSGKIVNQSDISSWEGMAHEIITHNEQHPEDPALWTNSMFSGMPATQISVKYRGDLTEYLYELLFWGKRPPSYFIISMVGAFLLFLAFGVNPWIGAIGAIAVSLCSYNMQIIQVGHNTKMVAIAFMPWVLAALAAAYRKGSYLSALLFGLALSFQIKANHPQITYYLAFAVVGYAIAELCGAIRRHELKQWSLISAVLLLSGVLGIATNANKLIPTYEYAAYTMRGGSELSTKSAGNTGNGLDIEYATAWSYGPSETFNLMIPNFNGGSSSGELSKDSNTGKLIRSNYANANAILRNMPLYWGPQPFTAGPMYMGDISIFLFILGLIVIKGRYKWWVVGVSLLALLLSYGYHLLWFSELFFKYVPLYNKFRTVSMVLLLLQITIPLLGFVALDRIMKTETLEQKKKFTTSLLISYGITGGICLLFTILPTLAGDFASSSDAMFGNNREIIQALRLDRMALLRKDAFTSFIFISIAFAAIYAVVKGVINRKWGIAAVAAAVIINFWSVDKRYLNESHFFSKKDYNSQFALTTSDKYILNDKKPDERVLDLTVNVFNNSITSYHHHTIGGYSPAKLQRYQDIIDYYLNNEIETLVDELNSTGVPQFHPIMSMLNTKYIIFNKNYAPLTYEWALGNGWMAQEVIYASSADSEIELLGKADTRTQAVVYNPDKADGTIAQLHGKGSVELLEYSPNYLKYRCNTEQEGIAVFSQVYYPAGWKAYIDGTESEILRTNYILRGVHLTPGEHIVEMRYAPASFKVGKNISLASSAILILMIISSILYLLKFKKNDNH